MNKPDEVSQWLDNDITQLFLEGLNRRIKLLEQMYNGGGTYTPGNPFATAENNAAYFARVTELSNIVNAPTLYLEREDEDERDWDTTSGSSPVGEA